MARASATVSAAKRARLVGLRSAVEATAERWSTKTRRPRRFWRASVSDLDVAHADPGAEGEVVQHDRVRCRGAGAGGAIEGGVERVPQRFGTKQTGGHACVPPTVKPSMRIVGSPTPTGTD